jgi:hypothetical protein
MPFPPLQKKSGYLPPGEFIASLEEIETRFGLSSERRKVLMLGLKKAVLNFREAGVKKIWIDGSFISARKEPLDIDGCWEYNEQVDLKKLDRCFVNIDRNDMRFRYGLDFFPSNGVEFSSQKPFPYFFQFSRDDKKKGIIILNIFDEAKYD